MNGFPSTDDLVETFLAALRGGETVDNASFLAEHPEQADELRDLLPVLREMEMNEYLPSDSLVTERVNTLKSTFSRWMAARQAISSALPEKQGISYGNMTADIFSRLIGKLADIIPYEEW